jgi:hypothetical protein
MTSFGTRVLSIVCEDPEVALASFSGTLTDSIIHPRSLKKLVPYVIKALIAGYLLAKFVSPAVAERFSFSEKEALAVSFICGYAGVRILTMGERIIEKKLESHFNLLSREANQVSSTDSSKASSAPSSKDS